MEHRYKVTTNGRTVMAACMALEKPFHIMRVAFGSGKVDENTNLADVHQLLEYVSDGAVAEKRHQDDRFYLTIQYANQQHPEVQTFLLSEFIVYGEDPETGEETDLLYGTLGDYRQPVPAYSPAYPPSVFNFPLELVLSSELQVLNSAPAGIVTWDDLSRALGELEPISNSGIPTSSTAGTVGQTYTDTDSGRVYTCIAAAVGESGETNYTWAAGRMGTLADIRAALSNKAALSVQQTVEAATVPSRTVEVEAAELASYVASLPRLLAENLTVEVKGGTVSGYPRIKRFYGPGSLTFKEKESGCEFSERLRNGDRWGVVCEITRKKAGTGLKSI